MDRTQVVNNMRSNLAGLRQGSLGVPVLLLAMLAMMMLPIPPLLLDLLFTFSITLSIVVLLVCVYALRPLDFQVFPTILLIATLLRHTGRTTSTPTATSTPATASVQQPPLIDRPNAIERLGGDAELYKQIVHMFLAEVPTQMAELQHHLEFGQHSDAARCAHTLKGLSATVGASPLSLDYAALEHALKTEAPTLQDCLTQVHTQLQLARAQLEVPTP